MLLIAALAPLMAQNAPESSGDPDDVELTVERLSAAQAETAQNQELEPSVRDRALELYAAAIKSLEAVSGFTAQQTRFEEEAAVSPARVAALQEEMDQPVEEVQLSLPEGATTAQIEERLTQARSELAAARQALRDEDQLSAQRMGRRREISARLGTLSLRLVQINDDLREALVTELHPELRQAQQMSLLAQRRLAEAETAALRAELDRHVARAPALPLRRDRAQRRVVRAQRTVDFLVAAVRENRVAKAREQLAEVKRTAEEAVKRVPALGPLAAEVTGLAERLSGGDGVRLKLEEASEDLSATRKSISDVQQAFENSRRKWEAVRYRSTAEQWWPAVPVDLQRPSVLRREIRTREVLIPECQHQLILLEEKRASGGDLQSELSQLLDQVAPAAGDGRQEASTWAHELLRVRRDLQDELITVVTQYSDLLYELDTASRQLLTEIEALEAFVLARVLWVRSVPGTMLPAVKDVAGGLVWLFGNPSWPAVWREAITGVRQIPLMALGGVLIIAALFWFRGWCSKKLELMSERVSDPKVGMRNTFAAAGLTALLAMPLPAVLLGTGLVLSLAEQYDLARAAATGLYACGALGATFMLVAESCRRKGLVEAHFGWPPDLTSAIHRNARLATAVVLPLTFVSLAFRAVGMSFHSPLDLRIWNNASGRVCFIVALVAVFVFCYRALRPAAPVLTRLVRAPKWFTRSRTAGVGLSVSLPLIPATAALFGYYITAAILAYFLLRSLWLLLALAMLSEFFRRWETLKRRNLAARASDGAVSIDVEGRQEMSRDLVVADAQVRQLFRFGVLLVGILGLFVIWSRFVPALEVLEQVQMWPSVRLLTDQELAESRVARTAPPEAGTDQDPQPTGTPVPAMGMAGAVMGASGAAQPSSAGEAIVNPPIQALMLSDLLGALLLLAATMVTAKNIPGLLEFAVLPRMRLDPGARAAIGTLVRYAIMLVGFSASFALLGLSWSKIQWLAAALTFGLAFGLQEIFANFVSGLILLLERPMRIGDAVTIGAITGRVARIQMRATTIEGWDKSELIVPNKEFITGQLVNWTLSDPRVRVDVPVGVAYGTDVSQVKEILLQVARQHPRVLADPPAEVFFLAFGPSSLEFELRVFILFDDGRLKVRDELQMAIDRAFRERGVVIAFPQMDIHVRTGALEQPEEAS